MTAKTPDQHFGELSELQNQIGNEMVEQLSQNGVDWDQTRLHVEHRGPDHYRFGLLYRKNEGKVQGVLTDDHIDDLAKKYISLASEAANDQVKRLRFHLTSELKFNIEMWYTPTEGLPGWTWEEEAEESEAD